MKNLNKYIKESLLDDEDEAMDRIGSSVIIEQFLQENYNLKNCKYTIKDRIVDIDGLITVKSPKAKELTQLTNGHFKFGAVGVFYCDGCEQLTSLEGAPSKVKGLFDCSNTGIKNLKGAPKEAGSFSCADCEQLTSLEGAPSKVKQFDCSGSNIKDLTGVTQQIEDTLDCSYCEKLESLKGAPKKIPGCLFLNDCPKLFSLKYCPKEIGGFIRYSQPIIDIKKEIEKNNIKVKKAISNTGGLTIQF